LAQRPEKFLDIDDSSDVTPIIDYHLMRSCLRTGLVRVDDPELRESLVQRRMLTPADEHAVRQPCYDAVRLLSRRSGRSIAAIDYFFFGARKRCPEAQRPDCAACPIDPVCQHAVELFQPVWRTTWY
jgi:hypothetical protein